MDGGEAPQIKWLGKASLRRSQLKLRYKGLGAHQFKRKEFSGQEEHLLQKLKDRKESGIFILRTDRK